MLHDLENLAIDKEVADLSLAAALRVLSQFPDGLKAYRGTLLKISESSLQHNQMRRHHLAEMAIENLDDGLENLLSQLNHHG